MNRPPEQTPGALTAETAIGIAAARLTTEFSAEIIVVLAVQSGRGGPPAVLASTAERGRTPELVASAVHALREIADELEREWKPD